MKISTHFFLTRISVLLALVYGLLLFGTRSLSSPNATVKNKNTPFRLRNDTKNSTSTSINTMLTSTIEEEEEENVLLHEEKKKEKEWYEKLHDVHPRVKYILMRIYVVSVVLQNVYAFAKCVNIARALLSTRCFRRYYNIGGYMEKGNEPHVTIQICTCNEANVIEGTIDAACSVDWPSNRLTVQVLDDSTEDKEQLVARERVKNWQKKGINCQHLTRPDRSGYKAGNLQYHEKDIDGDFVAFFDSDHRCDEQFLKTTIPYFFDHNGSLEGIGLVQTPWAYTNTHENLLTECDALIMDTHHVIEQQGRANYLSAFSFNGTGGVWRRSAIKVAGGWKCDTVTEDLDLSYEAFIHARRFVYVPELPQASDYYIGLFAL